MAHAPPGGPAAAYAEGQEVVFRLFDDGERVGTVKTVHRAAGGAVTASTVVTRLRLDQYVEAHHVLRAVSAPPATAADTPARTLTNRRLWEMLAKGAASPEARACVVAILRMLRPVKLEGWSLL